MPIDLSRLSASDIGRVVVYRPRPGGELEEGVITSFNEHYVFVRYGNDKHSKATRPEDLEFVCAETGDELGGGV